MQNWLEKRVDLTPDRVALVDDSGWLTFREVLREVQVCAAWLSSILDENPRVGVLVKNTRWGYIQTLALQYLGRQVVFLNFRLSDLELAYQTQDAGLTQVIKDPTLTNAVPCLTFYWDGLATSVPDLAAAPVALQDVATIMYTSGTTGRPKGVEQTYQNHYASAMGSVLNLGLQADDLWLAPVPIFHISGFSIMMRSLIYGIGIRLYERFDPEKINADLLDGQGTLISVVPIMLSQLLAKLDEGQHYPESFRVALLGGGPTGVTTLKAAEAVGVNVVQSYGMTETASQVVALSPEQATAKVGSVGKPLFSVEVRVKLVGEQTVGRVQVKSPTLTVGYLNRPDDYAAAFDDGWFDTGDMGYFDADGFLYLVGREGDMISSGGENVFPDEIEAVYQRHPAVARIGVYGVPDDRWGAVPQAVIEWRADANVTQAELLEFGRQSLAGYKLPKHFYQLKGAWPETASGKLQRYRLGTVLGPEIS